jgi:uncharacterized protein YjiS (DUF1127 family)
LTSAGKAAAGWCRRWRREVQVKRAAEDLRRLDRHRLSDLGIVDRSGIDWAVRHGRDSRATPGD